MRAMDCSCGHHLEAANDAELFEQARAHVDNDHPEMDLSNEELRSILAEGAYDK
jgi:predicted small metal-binding protein